MKDRINSRLGVAFITGLIFGLSINLSIEIMGILPRPEPNTLPSFLPLILFVLFIVILQIIFKKIGFKGIERIDDEVTTSNRDSSFVVLSVGCAGGIFLYSFVGSLFVLLFGIIRNLL